MISVFNCNSGNKAFTCPGGGQSRTEFKYSSGEDGSASLSGNYALFPWAASNVCTGEGALYFDIPAFCNYPVRPMLAACSKDAEFLFRHIFGALDVTISGSGSISRISLQGNGNEALAGRAVVKFDGDGIPSVNIPASGASSSVTMVFSPVLNPGQDAVTVRFLLPETSFDKGITILLTDAGGATNELIVTDKVDVRRGRETALDAFEDKSDNPVTAVVGEPLPLWEEGWLDIHSINGGRGEAFFYIFPDGTNMLVDAAGGAEFEIQGSEGSGIYSKPSPDYSSGTVINRYLQRYMPAISDNHIDYFLLSHYHSDHMGSFTKSHAKYGWKAVDKNGNPVSTVDINKGGFLLNGLPEVGMAFPITKLIDRGDWDNRASNVWSSGQSRRQNYLNFIDWTRRANGTIRESLSIGNTGQIVLKHKPNQYPEFSVRGIAANGDVWTGKGNSVNTTYLPSAADCLANVETWDINENVLSCVFTLSYGKFDWFAGGDIQYNDKGIFSWKDIEQPISKVVGKVEAMKACHHSTSNTNSSALLNALKPDSYVIGVWTKNQPNYATLKRVYAANKDVKIFATNLSGYIIPILGAQGIDAGSFLARGGHVVIRVEPGGGQYYVFVLDDSDFEYRITEIHGPYPCG
ncbi:MAG: hypothetical protein IKH11_07715 [Bacteroidales bacterium]|nr:hypothetical protein [Bacteroidales bacterium]